ncbi:hypothetical protein AB8A20_17745 [Tardiphaga sp. 604_B6_N1_1]|uniref:hypothetical protein n=1 Tax=Tardiphaga sp. 604_B6_N1_1 TaxID=3240779 RepID=UPI000FF09261
MPASMLMIAVDWYGPFNSIRSAKVVCEQNGVTDFLYLAISKDGKDKSYIGLSGNATGRLTEAHHILGGLEEGDIDLWIGLISSQSEAGRKPADAYVTHSGVLHIAEHMIAYLLETTENVSKRRNPPERSAAVFSRWFWPVAPWKRRSHRAHPKWPDFIEFDADEKFAKLTWFGGKLVKYDAEQIEGLKRD